MAKHNVTKKPLYGEEYRRPTMATAKKAVTPCEECNGKGCEECGGKGWVVCEACHGKGWIFTNNSDHGIRIERCDACQFYDSDEAAVRAVHKLATAQWLKAQSDSV